jgi:hypothetical protein
MPERVAPFDDAPFACQVEVVMWIRTLSTKPMPRCAPQRRGVFADEVHS